MEHPSGQDCRGAPDAIPHALDPAALRSLAPTIPVELVEEFMLLGNAYVADRLRPYAQAGVEHCVLADFTGITHEPDETARVMGQLPGTCEACD